MGFDMMQREPLPILPKQEDDTYKLCVWCEFDLVADMVVSRYTYGEKACPKCHKYIPVGYMRPRPK